MLLKIALSQKLSQKLCFVFKIILYSGGLVLDPATAAIHALPTRHPVWGDPDREDLYKPATFFAFDQAPATGEYKVLRMFNRPEPFSGNAANTEQLFDVFTINGGDAHWRVLSHEFFVAARSTVVVDGRCIS